MSQAKDLSYDEPWPMFSDEDEPWKDLERLLKWDGKMDTQKEMGDAFGCTPSTISYWLNKARDEVEPEYDDEELQCSHFEVCGNLGPSPVNGICTVCLDLMRHNQSAKDIDPGESEDVTSHMEVLYQEYPDFAEERQAAYDELHSDDEEDDGEDSEDES